MKGNSGMMSYASEYSWSNWRLKSFNTMPLHTSIRRKTPIEARIHSSFLSALNSSSFLRGIDRADETTESVSERLRKEGVVNGNTTNA